MIPGAKTRGCDLRDNEKWFSQLSCRQLDASRLGTLGDSRLERIDALRLQIAAGTYRVPTAVLAQSLMDRMLLPD